jgi:23S rRNA pseudouridine955/2504/2580 synthase
MININIIHEDSEIYIINKPAGIASQGGEKVTSSIDTVFAEQVGQKIYLVHRLDKDTSGLMIIAKNPIAANKWTKLISSKSVKKEYLAICVGSLKNKQGIIKEDLIQHGAQKQAITHYSVEKEWNVQIEEENLTFSLVRLILETGRMHQIRIHLAKQNCPIIADDQHGNFKLNKLLKKHLKIKKLMLAAVKLTIPNPKNTDIYQIQLPEHMADLIH